MLPLVLAATLFLGAGPTSQAQQLRPADPEPTPTPFQYVVIRAPDFPAAHVVETERSVAGVTQQLTILNLLVPLERAAPGLLPLAPKWASQSSMLITLVVLPDAADGQLHWQSLQPDTLAAPRRLPVRAFTDTCFQRLARYHRTAGRVIEGNALTRSAQVKPVLYRDGQYWTPQNYTLTEVFLICPVPFILPVQADNVTISIAARPYSQAESDQDWQLGRDFYPELGSNLSFLLASKLLLDQKRADGTYDFYTMPPNIVDGNEFYDGASTFRYQPGVGILSGSYQRHLPARFRASQVPFTTKRIVAVP